MVARGPVNLNKNFKAACCLTLSVVHQSVCFVQKNLCVRSLGYIVGASPPLCVHSIGNTVGASPPPCMCPFIGRQSSLDPCMLPTPLYGLFMVRRRTILNSVSGLVGWLVCFNTNFKTSNLCLNDQAYNCLIHFSSSLCIIHQASCIMHHASCIMHHASKTTSKMKTVQFI